MYNKQAIDLPTSLGRNHICYSRWLSVGTLESCNDSWDPRPCAPCIRRGRFSGCDFWTEKIKLVVFCVKGVHLGVLYIYIMYIVYIYIYVLCMITIVIITVIVIIMFIIINYYYYYYYHHHYMYI